MTIINDDDNNGGDKDLEFVTRIQSSQNTERERKYSK